MSLRIVSFTLDHLTEAGDVEVQAKRKGVPCLSVTWRGFTSTVGGTKTQDKHKVSTCAMQKEGREDILVPCPMRNNNSLTSLIFGTQICLHFTFKCR